MNAPITTIRVTIQHKHARTSNDFYRNNTNKKARFSAGLEAVLNTNRNILGAGRGTRTPTLSPAADFESAASTNSAIPAD